jgi:cell division protein FtsQ
MKALSLVLTMALGALLYQGAVVVHRSEPLQLKAIEVLGNDKGRAKTKELIDRAGITMGQSLLEVSTGEVALRVKSHPWVADASVERILPSRIRIEVIERTPAMLVYMGTGSYLVDRSGVVLQQGTEPLVKVLDLPPITLAPGTRISSAEFVHALSIFNALPAEIRWNVHTIQAASIDGITVETNGGGAIFYGAAEKLEEKNHAAQSLLATPLITGAKARVIDVRVPSRPAMRPA